MGFPDDFILPITACLKAKNGIPNFAFPPISEPGLPNFLLGCFESNFAGIAYVLNFIPPSPSNPPSPPGIGIFLQPFMAAVSLPASYPPISLTLGGVGISIPGQGSPPYAYDVSGEMKMICVMVALPFLIIKAIITGLLNLQLILPTLDSITAILTGILAEAGLGGFAVENFAGCLAVGILNLFTTLI